MFDESKNQLFRPTIKVNKRTEETELRKVDRSFGILTQFRTEASNFVYPVQEYRPNKGVHPRRINPRSVNRL